ncbi:MAG TPA: DNA cytosine methyltransferase [Candidatus Polarisedimenticolia bacterium]|nr:DNA cytosine methyltransferase [Candidatus Polarisedimenticolia bacterium]
MAKLKRKNLTALDLFSGCGGLTEGLKRARFRVLGAVEIDQTAADTYKLNHPEVHLWEKDIRDLKPRGVARELKLRKGQLDLLAGCPPCQGFSTMRTLNGRLSNHDRRNDLLFEFLRFVEGLRPKAIMMENVPGLARNRRFKRFCARLRELGYVGDYDILDAAKYGVPQRRKRLIYLAGFKKPVAFARPKEKAKTVREAISGLPPAGKSGDSLHDIPEHRSPDVQKRIESIPKNGGSRSSLPTDDQLDCHKACGGFKDVYGRMAWDKVAPTITTGCFNPSKGRFLHPNKNRAITIREAALLQGFRKGYKFRARHGKIALALMIGNALPPPFVAAHARSVGNVFRDGITADV